MFKLLCFKSINENILWYDDIIYIITLRSKPFYDKVRNYIIVLAAVKNTIRFGIIASGFNIDARRIGSPQTTEWLFISVLGANEGNGTLLPK